MKTFNTSDYLVSKPIRLKDIPTAPESGPSKEESKQALKEIGEKLAKLQDTMYAHNRYGVLVCSNTIICGGTMWRCPVSNLSTM
jgi:hypothetical protein